MQTQLIPIHELTADPSNVRKHPEESIAAIKASLLRFGQQKPIVIDANKVVIAGNGTLAAAKILGWKELSCVVSTLDRTELQAFSIADNRTAELSSWDDEALLKILSAMEAEEKLVGVGFLDDDLKELRDAMARMDKEGQDLDAVPEPMDTPITQAGDLWILGNHRLLCGDSSDPHHVDRLLGGVRIQLVNTDPPYNVKVEPRSNNAIAAGNSSFTKTHHQSLDLARDPGKSQGTTKQMRAKDRPLANDFVTDEKFDQLLDAWFGNMARVLEPGGAFYIWGGYANCANYPPVLKAKGLYFSQAIIWVKQHPVLTRKDFMGNHEWCFYGWREGAGHKFYGENNITDVWDVKKVNPQSMVHLTEKPVELARRAMLYSSQRGANVLDLFGGSGSTLIAAEDVERCAYLMELDTAYADVIVRRWQQVTGRKAVLHETGDTFEDVAIMRAPPAGAPVPVNPEPATS